MDDGMSDSLHQKRLDIIVSAILILFLLLGFLYRSSPEDFMNPGFPILRAGDLKLSEKFILSDKFNIDGPPKPERITNVNDFNEVTYQIIFHIEDTTQVFPDGFGNMTTNSFSVFQFVTRFKSSEEAKTSLQNLYSDHVENEGNPQIRVTDIPLANFSSKADASMIWCEGSREPRFNSEEVHTCYYWAVYDRYLSRTRVSMWPIRSWGRQFSLELFTEIITLAENKFL